MMQPMQAPRRMRYSVESRAKMVGQVRTLVHLVLEKQGFTVLAASDGGEALAVSADRPRAHRPGDAPGDERQGARRSSPRAPARIRTLFTSGYAQAMIEGRELDEDDAFLPKPFDQAELASAIRTVLATPCGG